LYFGADPLPQSYLSIFLQDERRSIWEEWTWKRNGDEYAMRDGIMGGILMDSGVRWVGRGGKVVVGS